MGIDDKVTPIVMAPLDPQELTVRSYYIHGTMESWVEIEEKRNGHDLYPLNMIDDISE
jgi:hypothetical protein